MKESAAQARGENSPDELSALAIEAAKASLDALVKRDHLKPGERDHIEKVHIRDLENGEQSEIFETITRLSEVPPRGIGDFMANLGLAVSKTLRERPPLVPGLERSPKPAALYEAFPAVAAAARALLCPVLYSEDNEEVGVGSVNPVPALRLSTIISSEITPATGVKPFISIVRLDYDTWRALLKRHFGL